MVKHPVGAGQPSMCRRIASVQFDNKLNINFKNLVFGLQSTASAVATVCDPELPESFFAIYGTVSPPTAVFTRRRPAANCPVPSGSIFFAKAHYFTGT